MGGWVGGESKKEELARGNEGRKRKGRGKEKEGVRTRGEKDGQKGSGL